MKKIFSFIIFTCLLTHNRAQAYPTIKNFIFFTLTVMALTISKALLSYKQKPIKSCDLLPNGRSFCCKIKPDTSVTSCLKETRHTLATGENFMVKRKVCVTPFTLRDLMGADKISYKKLATFFIEAKKEYQTSLNRQGENLSELSLIIKRIANVLQKELDFKEAV